MYVGQGKKIFFWGKWGSFQKCCMVSWGYTFGSLWGECIRSCTLQNVEMIIMKSFVSGLCMDRIGEHTMHPHNIHILCLYADDNVRCRLMDVHIYASLSDREPRSQKHFDELIPLWNATAVPRNESLEATAQVPLPAKVRNNGSIYVSKMLLYRLIKQVLKAHRPIRLSYRLIFSSPLMAHHYRSESIVPLSKSF